MRSIKARYFILLILVISLYGCENGIIAPRRKSNIPPEAKWYGAIDGGVWIKIDEIEPHRSYQAYIYNEFTGLIIDSGQYQICKGCEGDNKEHIKEIIDSYDGEKIFLNTVVDGKNCYLLKGSTK